MQAYYIGLTMRSETHDYSKAHRALALFQATRLSPRIWLCLVDEAKSEFLFLMLRFCLDPEDDMMAEKVASTPIGCEVQALAA